jgi:hypothetical protein
MFVTPNRFENTFGERDSSTLAWAFGRVDLDCEMVQLPA